ncbi:MAG: glutamine-hydrolyzing GMP synthase [Spirochaetales bacterium]
MDTIAVLDFGSQTTQLIGRRIRDLGVYSEVLPGTEPIPGRLKSELKGVILGGSPSSVHEADAPTVHESVFDLGVPILGICFGLQQLVYRAGGSVSRSQRREYGRSPVWFKSEHKGHPLFRSVPDGFVSWMSHGDSLERLPDTFSLIAQSENGLPAAVATDNPDIVGIQFHPEVTHCEYGVTILENFALSVCGARRQWSMEAYLDQAREEIRRQVGNRSVLVLISGGVDSTVTAALLLNALEADQVHLMYIDTGLMRKNESLEVQEGLKRLGARHLHVVDASARFFDKLEGHEDPEEKRRIIGDLFMSVQQHELVSRGIGEDMLAQGTLYTDLIESGKGVGGHAKVIKSHHNVRSPLVSAKRDAGLLVEPLSWLYKDEVRQLGRVLDLPESVVGRHPFPGPGLAVRILGEVTRERVRILQQADAIYTEELWARGLYDKIWQAFAVLLPVRSVGVAGDSRAYGSVVALRAVSSSDGMTAEVFPMEPEDLLSISGRITNEVPEVGRVVYDVSSKPPATIEWE